LIRKVPTEVAAVIYWASAEAALEQLVSLLKWVLNGGVGGGRFLTVYAAVRAISLRYIGEADLPPVVPLSSTPAAAPTQTSREITQCIGGVIGVVRRFVRANNNYINGVVVVVMVVVKEAV
jgi:hypothetical protein